MNIELDSNRNDIFYFGVLIRISVGDCLVANYLDQCCSITQ